MIMLLIRFEGVTIEMLSENPLSSHEYWSLVCYCSPILTKNRQPKPQIMLVATADVEGHTKSTA